MLYGDYPDWLPKLGFRRPGVGSSSDLEHFVIAGDGGRWLSFLQPGWYYLNNLENYYYRDTRTTTGSGVVVSDYLSYWPQRGPILVTRSSQPLNPVFNILSPATSMVWTDLGDGVFKSNHSSSQELINVRGLYLDSLSYVPASGSLQPDNSYWYDEVNRDIYVKSASSPASAIYADFYTSPSLTIQEVLFIRRDGKVYPSYPQYSGLILARGTSSINVGSGSGGVTFSGAPGQWVRATYVVPDSYTLSNHRTITTNASGTVSVSYEGSFAPFLQPISLTNSPDGENFNLNPLLSSAPVAGFLFVDESSPTYEATSIRLSSDSMSYDIGAGEIVKVVLETLTSELLVCPWVDITPLFSGVSEVLAQFPDDDQTDIRGRKTWYLTGSGDITVSITAGSVTGSVTVTQADSWTPSDSTYQRGQVTLVATPIKLEESYFQSYVTQSFLDGIPKLTSDPVTVSALGNSSILAISPAGYPIEYRYQTNFTTNVSGRNILGVSEVFGLKESNKGKAFSNVNTQISKIIFSDIGGQW